jgi:hypothetical protein
MLWWSNLACERFHSFSSLASRFGTKVNVGEYIPDLIAFNAVVVDAKVIEAITDHERGQLLNYLRITRHNVGVILNFKRVKLEWERIVLDQEREETKQPPMNVNEREFGI